MVNKNLQKNDADEILSVGDAKIRQMIKNLSRVDVPKDFDFRLKARIANAKPTDFQPRFFPVLRYVLPLSVVVLVFTFVIINGVYFAGSSQTTAEVQPISVELKPVLPAIPQNTPAETAQVFVEPAPQTELPGAIETKIKPKTREVIPLEKTKFMAAKSPKKVQPNLPKENEPDEGGGSLDSSYKNTELITPRGIFPADPVESSPNNENKNDVITKQILLPHGIEVVSENGNRRVKSVKKGSVAELSGVQIGDLVEAIDGEKVSGDAVRGKKLEGKQITVLRGTEKVEITFNNQ